MIEVIPIPLTLFAAWNGWASTLSGAGLGGGVEVGRVERREVELQLAVRCRSGPGSRPRLRRHAEMEGAPGGLGLELLPAPEPDEVVAVVLEELEVRVVVELLRGLGAVRAGTHAVVEVVPDVRAGQVDHLPVGGVAGCDCEVAWIGL